MKENTGTIIAMLEELLTISKSRQASQSGSTNAANMDIAPFKTLIEEAGQRTEAGLENLFELNQDNGKIKQIRKDVETYEEVRLKEQTAREQENRADSIGNKPSKSR